MDIQYGADVVDRNGKLLGSVVHVVPDTWDGGVRKFMVKRESPDIDILISPESVHDVKDSKIILKVTVDELGDVAKL